MEELFPMAQEAEAIAIAGHRRPDGDCIGSCLALYNYLTENYNADFKKIIDVYLDPVPEEFLFLKNADKLSHTPDTGIRYDLFICLDCGSADRLGWAEPCFHAAKHTVNVDHHISNTGFAKKSYVVPEASSTCEVLYGLMEKDRVSMQTAECLYLGIVHDTGVFSHSNTTGRTMAAAGELLEKGVSAEKIVNNTFYRKTYVQNQILGRCLLESILVLDGKVIFSSVSKKIQELYGIKPSDLDGVIEQLRVTDGVEVAILLREEGTQQYKVSMRANETVDVSRIAMLFGGGGHVKAAGCTMNGSLHDVINNLTGQIEDQMELLSQKAKR